MAAHRRVRERVLPWITLLLAGFAAAGCGASEPPPARQRLTSAAGTLHTLPHAEAVPVLSQEFDALPKGWHTITGTQDVLAVRADALRRTLGHEGTRNYLTLAGSGATYRALTVEGDTPYLFEGLLRARDLEPEETPFHGALFWVAETSIVGSTPAELFGQGKRFDLLHPVASVWDQAGWQERRLAFRTRPGTRTLIVGCVLTVDEPIRSGEVDFDRLSLARLSERELWEFQAAEAVAQAHRGGTLAPAGDWRARRLVGAMLGAEQRPAILCFPGERLTFELEVPAAQPLFRAGVAPWPSAHRLVPEVPSQPQVYLVSIDGRELLREEHALAPLTETPWRDVQLDLAPFAGRRVRLELGVDGPLPGLFGAPEILATGAQSPGWNVVLVSIDTLRADHVGAYGARNAATPRLDRLAREGLVFTDMNANAPYTLPAHASMFSGQFPSVHAVEDRGRLLASSRSPILAEILAARGYRTQAFAAGGFLVPDFGFDAGFDGFSIADPLRHPDSRYFPDVLRRDYPDQDLHEILEVPGVERVRRWLGAHAREPFFLFLHTYQVHEYDPPPSAACAVPGCTSKLTDYHELLFPKKVEPFPGTPEDRAHLQHLYDAALRDVDQQLGRLLDELARLGLAERTLVVVTSDHGEEFFERGHLQHGKTLYDELLRVPLVLSIPGAKPARLAFPAMQVDLAPTILGALGIPPDARMQGLDLLHGTPRARPLWAEVNDHFSRKSSLRDATWKLVHGPPTDEVSIPNEHEWELYELASDPGEAQELSEREPERLKSLQHELEGFQEHLRNIAESLGPIRDAGELDESTNQLLEHLGYGGGK